MKYILYFIFYIFVSLDALASELIDSFESLYLENQDNKKMYLLPNAYPAIANIGKIREDLIIKINDLEFIINFKEKILFTKGVEKKIKKSFLFNEQEKVYSVFTEEFNIDIHYNADVTTCDFCFSLDYSDDKLNAIYLLTPVEADKAVNENVSKVLMAGLLVKKEMFLPKYAKYLYVITLDGITYYLSGNSNNELFVVFSKGGIVVMMHIRDFGESDPLKVFEYIRLKNNQ